MIVKREKVVRLPEHPRSIIGQGIAALESGGPTSLIMDALAAVMRIPSNTEGMAAALRCAAPPESLSYSDRVRMYAICARLTAVIPDTYVISEDPFVASRFKQEYLRRFDSYHCFTPAWELSDVLERVFGKDDPGKVIGRHLAMLFDRRRLADLDAHVYLKTKDLKNGTGLASAMLGWVGRGKTLPSDERVVCEFLGEHLASEVAVSPPDALVAVLSVLAVPQALFTTLLNGVIGYGLVDLEQGKKSIEPWRMFLILVLLSCTAPRCQSSEYISHNRQAIEFLNRVAEAERARTNAERSDGPPNNPQLVLARCVEVARDVIKRRSATGDTAPVVPPQLLPRLIGTDDVFELLEPLGAAAFPLGDHIAQAERYRQRNLAGVAPFELEEMYLLNQIVKSDIGQRDLAYQLSQLWMSASDSGGELTHLPAWFGDASRDCSEALNQRSKEYAALYRAAKSDGLTELSAAIAAFFVISQSLRYGGRIGEWPEAGEWLGDALRLPESEVVRKAIRAARQNAVDRHEAVTAARLVSLLDRDQSKKARAAITIVDNPAFGSTSAESVRQLLEERFGRGRLAKLSPTTLEFWSNAHAKEAAHRGQQILGLVQQWGSVAEDLCKPFEAELISRLGPVYRSDWYREFKTSVKEPYSKGKPTLGNLLFLLNDYKRLPAELQAAIDSVVQLHHTPGLKKRLQDLGHEHRNAGAHPESYDLEKLNSLMTLLYTKDGGLWDTFLDALT